MATSYVKLQLIWKYVDSKPDYIFPLVFNVISVVNVRIILNSMFCLRSVLLVICSQYFACVHKKTLHYEDKADVVRGDRNLQRVIPSTKLTIKE
jgi:hypothetical protein